ncbi:MAG: hypothetical protein R3F43_13725 [bacterium]
MIRSLALLLVALVLAPAPAAAQRRLDDPDVRDALEALKQEPSIQRVQAAAVEFYRVDPDTTGSMRTRAAWKAILPEVNVGYRTNDATTFVDRFDAVLKGEGPPVGQDDATTQVGELVVSGSWSLPRLLYNPETLDVTSLAVLHEGVIREVTNLYYTRRRLQVDLILDPPADGATRFAKELRIEQLTATLDGMTGGLYTRTAERRRR